MMHVGVMILLAVMYSEPATKTKSAVTNLDAKIKQIDSFLSGELKTKSIPGMSVAIAVDDRLAWSKGYGLADVENEVPATAQTVYPIPGISRMITAVAVLQLVQQGKVTLDTSIREFVPELPDKSFKIAVRHVLANMSGLRHFKNMEEYANRKRFPTMVDAVEALKNDPLTFKPGDSFRMSAPAYNLLGLLIERIGSTSLDDYLKKNIFEPAGMKSSFVDRQDAIIPHRVRGYSRDRTGKITNAPLFDPSDRIPSDGYASSADDMARFMIALDSDKLMQPEMRKLMTTSNRTNNDDDTKYGLGCFVREQGGRIVIGHGGRRPDASAFLMMLRDEHVGIVVLSNSTNADVQAFALEIARLLIDNFNAKAVEEKDAEP